MKPLERALTDYVRIKYCRDKFVWWGVIREYIEVVREREGSCLQKVCVSKVADAIAIEVFELNEGAEWTQVVDYDVIAEEIIESYEIEVGSPIEFLNVEGEL